MLTLEVLQRYPVIRVTGMFRWDLRRFISISRCALQKSSDLFIKCPYQVGIFCKKIHNPSPWHPERYFPAIAVVQ